ncbi:uncharacterized protein LOC133306471 isoform X2 [Gastrolobium bilobum]|uniref:uncharacterized protein LOC133306471 isoform X2 n=1 Tax=Gastrolobium bilobum TaxID=150636 RepID=UPI002AB036BC|nr:uncharacterized protein LOC133306471 isoform X2 [Gastrolobium bilobum]
MPGTILVSVLEFMDLPLSSSTSIRVSLGKIEYPISDKGNFSFPLTSLRDDLIFKIQDIEGNEISRAGVHIRLILEKGVWEDTFPLGAGHLHLKLQFILNDEERDRIRIMRQSALKKKHNELLSRSQRGAERDSSTVIDNAALPFSSNDEVSEWPMKHPQIEGVSRLESPVGFFDDKESATGNVVGAQLDQKQLNTNIADQYKETSPSKPVSEPANQSPPEKQPQRVIASEEMGIWLGSGEIDNVTNNLIQPKQEEDGVQYSEKKSSLRRTPSNVRKMISAFECGMAQDKRSHIKPPPTKYQESKTETKDSSKTEHLEQDESWNIEPAGFLQERVESALEGSYELRIHRDSPQKLDSVGHFDNNYYSYESSGVWIFPDELRKICITTSGKSVMSIGGSQDTKRLSHQRSLDFSKIKNAAYVGTGTEGSKHEKIQEIEESKTNTSDDNIDENSGGPINQVMKVAIIIGFGILVLLTRQRKRSFCFFSSTLV